MQQKSKQELYQDFIHFVQSDTQKRRTKVNRQMFYVLFWCFLMPIITSVVLLILVYLGALPYRVKSYLDWIILIFPIAYAFYFLGFEVLKELPKTFQRGGLSATLSQTIVENQWRDTVCQGMKRAVSPNPSDWAWIVASFRMDIRALAHRNRHLTALSGAVFFLIMKGIDLLGEPPIPEKGLHPVQTIYLWADNVSSSLWQLVLFVLFLVLFYLSGSQNQVILEKYLDCARILKDDKA